MRFFDAKRTSLQLFYTDRITTEGLAYLPEAEARHCLQVLRHQIGDEITFTNGQGGWFRGDITEAGKKSCTLRITHREQRARPSRGHLHLVLAPPKSIDRTEWFLEKATEIGVDAITLMVTEHSERRRVRTDRLAKVVRAAMKQSLKAYEPTLTEGLLPFERVLEEVETQQKFIAYLGDGVKGSLAENYRPGGSVCILVGPEGGFGSAEVELARQAGYSPVSLGTARLRTETAGVVACHIINLLSDLKR